MAAAPADADSMSGIRAIPKAELHVHLEGSISPETVLQLAKKNNVPLPADSVEELAQWYTFRDFPHFVEVYVAVTRCIKSAADLEFIAIEFLEGQAAQGIRYTEATFTASTVETYCGIPIDEQLDALGEAMVYGHEVLGSDMQLVLDIVRGQEPEAAMKTVEAAARWHGRGVCALGIAGFESRGTKQYAEAFQEAKRLGLPVTAHAGETEGPWSIRETLEVTGAARIGHGVRALEDPDLVAELKDRGTVLEVCPTSNVRLGVFPSLAEHPIQKLIDAGLKVTINSDDPPMFGTSLCQEIAQCSQLFGWTDEDIRKLQRTAAEAAFLKHWQREDLLERLG